MRSARSLAAASPDFREFTVSWRFDVTARHALLMIARRAGMRSPAFECAVSYGALESAWVRAAGELDLAAVPILAQTLQGAVVSVRLLVLDLRDLTFIDPAGVRVIVDACATADRSTCRVVMLQGPLHIQRTIALTGLDRLTEPVADAADIDRDPTLCVVTLH